MADQEEDVGEEIGAEPPPDSGAHCLLVVGPLPPPPDGPSVSFQLFCDEIQDSAGLGELRIVDSSPKRLKDTRTPRFSTANLRQMARILTQFARQLRGADRVLVFGGDRFLLTIGAMLLGVSKLTRKPCFFRVFGGSLDIYDRDLPGPLRRLFRFILRRADGLIVQTELLHDFLSGVSDRTVYLVPGYRPLTTLDEIPPRSPRDDEVTARLAFVGHVREEKGVLVLLEALRQLGTGAEPIRCEIFGPVYESFEQRFRRELATTPNATYRGVLDPDEVINTLRRYDALVFPTFYEGEGHPGVLIEAMMAGVPVVTTAFRSIPELVEDRVNGLLVAPRNAGELAAAMRMIAENTDITEEMGRRNWERRMGYDARRLAPLIAVPLGVRAAGGPTAQEIARGKGSGE